METPDIFDSKIKELRIELPHYGFSHSSSGDSPHSFIGRKRTREKLKKLVKDATDKTGVYLVTGNRGVGKTSLVNQVIKETSLQPNSNFFKNLKYLFTLLFFVAGTQFCLEKFPQFAKEIWVIWPILLALSFIAICCCNDYRHKILKQTDENQEGIIWNGIVSALKELSYLINPYRKMQYLLKIISVVSFTQIVSRKIPCITPTKAFFIYLAIVFLCMYIRFLLCKYCEYTKKELTKKHIIFKIFCDSCDSILNPITNYIKNHSRLYLRINFGHKLKDEKDILRLIARTLSTEYHKYRYSFWRMLPWRAMAFIFLFLFAYMFSNIISGKKLEHLDVVFSKVETNIGVKVDNLLLTLDTLVSEISKKAVKVPQEFWNGKEENVHPVDFNINYLFWLSFFSMYLFCVLLFRCTWITHFFVTHGIITRRLKNLNSDITHSTERENSTGIIGINNERICPGIVTRTKKSRNVADAREIEKELQDILDDMQQIPRFMCCPNIVIVFDELDKVEPGDASLEKENPQTKASMFSIGATRERQTEILRILSNMKYFLSTAKAKFIFIAGREMYDIYLADVSERSNYIGSIFNAVIYVPSFLIDHPTSITSLTEEFVCRKLLPPPCEYQVKSYDLENYREYLENVIYNLKDKEQKKEIERKIQKVIAVLQQFIIYLAHLSKGAPKKMMQLFESYIKIPNERDEKRTSDFLVVQRYDNSKLFLSFSYYRQYALGIVAYLITPIFYRLSESNIREHSDKLLVSSLRFVDFLFKFHKHSFSWKHLDMSPEMLEVNRAPELKSVAVDLLNYLAQVHINKSNFNLSDYKFDGLIANEIFAMTKTDEVFSALFSFSLDETLPLKKHYQDLLERTWKEYQNDKNSSTFIDAISSLQAVLGDLHYYDDELEEAEAYYKSAVQALRKLEQKNNDKAKKDDDGTEKEDEKMTLERLYLYVRNMLRLGMIYEKRKQYDFAYLTYGELCKRIIREQNIDKDDSFKKMTYEGLKILYLPFIAKLQILEKSHIGGIASNHLEQLDKEFDTIDHKEAKLLKAEFYSRVADILYYKNLDLEDSKFNYRKALCTLLNRLDLDKPDKNTVIKLLSASVEKINDNYNMKFCTTLARMLSDWGNVFFSCDNTKKQSDNLEIYINYVESGEGNRESLLNHFDDITKGKKNLTEMEIAFAMYAISLQAYCKASLYKRSAYQIYKMLCLFKHYEIYKREKSEDYIKRLSKKAINYLWYANENLNVFELNKRKKDFDKPAIKEKIPLQNLLVDSEITRIQILAKELKLKLELSKIPKIPEDLTKYYDIHITSPYKINYSIVGRIYRLRLKTKVNYEAYKMLINNNCDKKINEQLEIILGNNYNKNAIKTIFGEYFGIKENKDVPIEKRIYILENLIAETIFCLIDIVQLSETMDETYLFPHSFLGSIHKHLSFWIRRYETYEKHKKEKPEIDKHSKIDELLKQYLGEEWREQLSGGYRESQKALSHYYKCLEMHKEGRAYHNMIDTMCYIKDDYNDRSDHFNIAEERHLIENKKIKNSIDKLKNLYNDSELYKMENYFKEV
jgi:exonuclease VII small subunit